MGIFSCFPLKSKGSWIHTCSWDSGLVLGRLLSFGEDVATTHVLALILLLLRLMLAVTNACLDLCALFVKNKETSIY